MTFTLSSAASCRGFKQRPMRAPSPRARGSTWTDDGLVVKGNKVKAMHEGEAADYEQPDTVE